MLTCLLGHTPSTSCPPIPQPTHMYKHIHTYKQIHLTFFGIKSSLNSKHYRPWDLLIAPENVHCLRICLLLQNLQIAPESSQCPRICPLSQNLSVAPGCVNHTAEFYCSLCKPLNEIMEPASQITHSCYIIS